MPLPPPFQELDPIPQFKATAKLGPYLERVLGLDRSGPYAWTNTCSPENTWSAIRKIAGAPAAYQLSHLIARLCFRGIYFPQKGSGAWFKVLLENRRVILRIMVNCLSNWKGLGIPEPLALPQHSDLSQPLELLARNAAPRVIHHSPNLLSLVGLGPESVLYSRGLLMVPPELGCPDLPRLARTIERQKE